MTLERHGRHAAALPAPVGEALGAQMTARARDAAVGRELLVMEQPLAERALFLRERIRAGNGTAAGRRNCSFSCASDRLCVGALASER